MKSVDCSVNNTEKMAAARSREKWKKANPEKFRQSMAKSNARWKKANPGKWNAIAARYRAAKLQRSPHWLTDDHLRKIQEFYDLAATQTRELGVPMQVDHIIPLRGKLVSGLHVPWNLQILPKSVNASKRNKFVK